MNTYLTFIVSKNCLLFLFYDYFFIYISDFYDIRAPLPIVCRNEVLTQNRTIINHLTQHIIDKRIKKGYHLT